MTFEWDEQKRQENRRKHGIDFADSLSFFDGPRYTWLDTRHDYGEDRWVSIGFLRNIIVVTVYTDRPGNVIHLISMRKALTHERKTFAEKLRHGLGPA